MHRLREFDVVAVTLPEAGLLRDTAFKCHVIAIAGTTIALEPVDRPAVTWLPEFVDGTFLTFSHGHSLIALKGALLQRGAVGDLRFKVTDPTREDRRKSSRIGVCLPVTVAGRESLTVNLSADGLLVDSDAPVLVGADVDVALSLPGYDEPLSALGNVIRVEDGRVALQFTGDAMAIRSRLATFVLEQNRVTLRHRLQTHDPYDFDF